MLTMLTSSFSYSHDFFLYPSKFSATPNERIKISIHVDDVFPGKAVKWSSSRVLRFEHRFGSGLMDLSKKLAEADSSGVLVPITGTGIHLFALDWDARLIDLKPEQFSHYLASEGLDHVLRMRKERGEEKKNGKERYSRFVKTLIDAGEGNNSALRGVVGQTIELVPLDNPYASKPGGSIRVQLLFRGIPLQNALVSSTYVGATDKPDTYMQSARTNEEGIVSVKLTLGGPWLIRTVHMLPIEKDKDADWESWWASITFEVKK